MSCVNKLFKKPLFKNKLDYLLLAVLVVCVFIVLLILQIRNSKKLIFLSVIDHYSYVLAGEEDVMEPLTFTIKCSRNDTMYFDKSLINTVYLYDQTTQDSYQVLIDEINLQEDKFYYQNDGYYDYQLKIKIPFKTSSQIQLTNFYLRLEYQNDEKLNFKMGSLAFIFDNDSYQNNFLISNLKGIINEINNQKTLVGINLKIESKQEMLTLNSIETISSKVKTNLQETKIISSELNFNDDITEILGKDYDLFKPNNQDELNLVLNNNTNLFVPLIYNEYCQIKVLGLIINYTIADKQFSQLIYPFKFFETTSTKEIEKMSYKIN